MKTFHKTVAFLLCALFLGIFANDASAQIFRRRTCEPCFRQSSCCNVGYATSCSPARTIVPRVGSFRGSGPPRYCGCCVCIKDTCSNDTCDVEVVDNTYIITEDCDDGCRCPIPNMGEEKLTIVCDSMNVPDGELLINVDFETIRPTVMATPMTSKYRLSTASFPNQQRPKIDIYRTNSDKTTGYWQITIQERDNSDRDCDITGREPSDVFATITLRISGSAESCPITVGERGTRNAFFDQWMVKVKHRPNRP